MHTGPRGWHWDPIGVTAAYPSQMLYMSQKSPGTEVLVLAICPSRRACGQYTDDDPQPRRACSVSLGVK